MKFLPPSLAVVLAFPSLSWAVSLAGACLDVPRVKETVPTPPGWVQHGLAPADHVINLNVGLPLSNFDVLERHLNEVSDPFHTRYGQHLSKSEVEALVAPHSHSLDAVNSWLACHGVGEADIIRSPAKDWATIKVPVMLAEKMLDTTYHIWKNVKTGDTVVRTLQYSLPQRMHEHIDVIQPTTMFARFRNFNTNVHWDNALDSQVVNVDLSALDSAGVTDPSCNSTITITCLQQLYRTAGYRPKAGHRNHIGITGYLGQFANIADLQLFFANQTPAALGSSFSFISVNGGLNSQNISLAGVEANLDTQFAFGLSHPTPGVFYSTAGSPPFISDENTPNNTNEPYFEWLNYVISENHPPQVISTSYGDDEQTVPRSYALRICKGFAQLGVRGISLLFASGDNGVGDGNPNPANQTCRTNDGRNVTRFLASFPASCPHVTTVGGTFRIPEVAAPLSGGGFSEYFPRPEYQSNAVQQFLSSLPHGTYDGLFNKDGRMNEIKGYPDISGQAVRYLVFVGGLGGRVSGTSASTPTVAAIVALLNDARISSGRPPLGFLNPLLYSKGVTGLTDITSGNAPGCGTPGFTATAAWDPVTGLGTPIFTKLLKIVA